MTSPEDCEQQSGGPGKTGKTGKAGKAGKALAYEFPATEAPTAVGGSPVAVVKGVRYAVGDKVKLVTSGWTGTIERIVFQSQDQLQRAIAYVKWDKSGFLGKQFCFRLSHVAKDPS